MTAVTLRPNGSSTSSITVTGAASTHAALSDDSAASYATGTAADGSAAVALTTTTLPAGSLVKQIRGRMRTKSTSTTPTATLRTGGINLLTVSTSIDSGSFVETAGVWTPAEIRGDGSPVLTQAAIDAAEFWVLLSKPSTPIDALVQMSELYADLVYVAKPVTVVTAVTPDPYTASNIIPVAWTNTLDADGGAQTRYRLKAFTAAQYGAGGFDPETSTPFYDSGETISAGTSASTSVLDNSTTYRVYVKVAQTVNGVSHWSAWAYDEFAVSVTTADISTVVGVANNTTASIAVTVTRSGATAWEFMEVERSTDAGATWSPVRGATYVPASGTSFVVTDYETGNGQSTKYRARATRIVSTLPITGSWVESSAVSWTSASPWLKSPDTPAINKAIDIDDPFVAQTFGVRVGVFDVVGRDAPVTIGDVLSSPSSTLMVRTNTDAAFSALLTLLRAGMLLYHPTACEGGTTGRYIRVTGVTEQPKPIRQSIWRVWSIAYVEIAIPPDPAASAP